MIVRMSGPIAATEGSRSITSLYLEFAEHGASPVHDSELVIDQWPNGVQRTLGWSANQLHGTTAQVVGAAAVAATLTHVAAGKMGAENGATSPTFGHFARTRTFAGFLDSLNSERRMDGQAPALYMVANFCDPRTPLLRTSTVSKNLLANTVAGRGHRGPEADVIRANDELYIGTSGGRLRDLCTQAIHRVLERDYGLAPDNEDMLRIYTRWAIVHRFGQVMNTPNTATTVHMGQFMAACYELEGKLPRGTKLQDVLPPSVFTTFAQGRTYGVKALPVREPNGSYSNVQPLRTRQRTLEDVEALMRQNQFESTPQPLKIRAADLLTARRIEVPDSETLEAALARLNTGESCLSIMRLGKTAIQVKLGNCRDETVDQMKIDDRRRLVNTLMHKGQTAHGGGHRRGVYQDYPYLRPGAIQAIYEDDRRTEQMAANPAEALAQLIQLQQRGSQGGPPVVSEVMAAFAAASLGSVEERRQAFAALTPSFRGYLRANLTTQAPLLTIRSLRDVKNMAQKYGYTYEEIVDLGIATAQQEVELPLQVYVPAAVALLENPESIFAVAPRKTGAIERMLRGDAPPPDDPTGSSVALKELQHHLYAEAGSRYGVDIHARMPGSGQLRRDHLNHPIYDTEAGDLLVACRLSEGLEGLMANNPTVRGNVLRIIGPVLSRNNPDDIQRAMPPLVYRQFMTLRNQYHHLLSDDQGGGGRFGFRRG